MKAPVKDINTYLSLYPEKVRVALEKLRYIILSVAPDAVEVISYGMPAFKYHGMLVGFAAFKEHCSLFPWDGKTILVFKDELKNYSVSKGTIRFTTEKPLPVALIKKIVKYRVKMNLEKEAKKKKISK